MSDPRPVRWPPAPVGSSASEQAASLPLLTFLRRGAVGRCPACGLGRAFVGWLRVAETCAACAAPLGEIRADDAPPYFTVLIVAHVAIGALVGLERVASLSVSTEMLIFLPGTLLLTLGLIRPVKWATLGLMLRMGLGKPPDPIRSDAA